jgi:hypothetical protein
MNGPWRPLERISRVTPFGIRFVDEATGSVVSDGLTVEVYPAGQRERRVAARPNRIGTFVAAHLGGPRDPDFEFGAGDEPFWTRGPTRPHTVEVADRNGNFQPFVFEHPLPQRGHVVPSCVRSSPLATLLPLYSTASRIVPAGIAVVRAELRYPVVSPAGRTVYPPAAWAVLEARVQGEPPARGIADREGRVAILLSYPEPTTGPVRPASPPPAGGRPLASQEWDVVLDAYFEPLEPPPERPDLCRTLAQARAALWVGAPFETPLGPRRLSYGADLIVRSEASDDPSMLLVTPAGSPP